MFSTESFVMTPTPWSTPYTLEHGAWTLNSKPSAVTQYIGDGKLATIFEISVGMIDRGSSISFLSQFPGEEEVLMPPRSNIEVRFDQSAVQESVICFLSYHVTLFLHRD